MSDEITLGEIHRLLLEVRADVKLQNGTVNKHETRISLLEDRAVDARQIGAKWGGFVGGMVYGLLYALQQLFSGHK